MTKKKTNRKFLAVSASTALVAAAVAPSAMAASSFPDVPSDSIYAKPVSELADAGIIKGYPDGKFHLRESVTRAEASKMVSLIRELDIENAASTPFKDVKQGAWYTKYINALYGEKLIDGLPGGTFGPNETLTRGQFAKMVFDAYGLERADEVKLPFTDVKADAWYTPYIKALYKNNLITGVTDKTFAPGANIKRGDFALLLTRADNLVGPGNVIDKVWNVDDVTVDEGAEVKLPEKVKVTYADGTVKEVDVKWDTSKLDVNKPGTYTLSGLVTGTAKPATVKVIVNAVEPKVVSVDSMNAKEMVFKFNKAVKKDTVIQSDGTLVDNAITLNSLDNSAVTADAAAATLSEDGKTLTLQAQASEVFKGRYDVEIAKGAIKSVDGKNIEKFSTTTSKFEDKTAPSITGATNVTATQAKVSFSEPLNETDAASLLKKASFKYADGTAISSADITGSVLSNDKKSLTIGLSNPNITAGKDINVTFIGVKDYAGNIITPNPSTITIKKGNNDGVAPTVVDLKAINNKTLEVKFSEELAANPTVTVNGGNVVKYIQDQTDKTKYTVELDVAQAGLKSVTVSAYSDLSGEAGASFTKVVNFDTDTIAPKLVKTDVVKGSDNAEYLEFTFDEKVAKLAALNQITVSGTKVKDYVTTGVSVTVPATQLNVDTNDNKVARVKLSNLLSKEDVEGAVYDLTLTGKDNASATVSIFEDISGNDGASSMKVSFTRGKDGSATSDQKATIDTTIGDNGISAVDNNTITVAFNQELDGASATDVNNYKFNGAVVDKAVLNPVKDGKQTVTLTLKPGSNTFTGERNVTITGVKAKNGLVMDTYNTTEVLNENVAPTVTNAILTDVNKVKLTFSEAVTNAPSSAADFELYIGGMKVAEKDEITTADQTTPATTIVLTLENEVTAEDIAKGLTIKAVDTIDVKDAAGNIVSVPSAIAVNQ